MIRSLRKGQTSIEVWYKYGEDTIGAKQAEIEPIDDYAVFRIKLAPVDGNQSSDANKIFLEHPQTITKVIIRDDQIRNNAAKYLKANADKIKFVHLELVHNKTHGFSTDLIPLDEDGLIFEIKT